MKQLLSWITVLTVLVSCGNDPVPKPVGYMRIELPPQLYQTANLPCAYQFDYNHAAILEAKKQDCWTDIVYPNLRTRIQITYKDLHEVPLETVLHDAHELAFKHSVVADGIKEQLYENPERKVYGIFYRMAGNAASTTQFFATDSVNHFLRAVLYYYAEPNRDSIAPVDQYMEAEMVNLLESLQWKNP